MNTIMEMDVIGPVKEHGKEHGEKFTSMSVSLLPTLKRLVEEVARSESSNASAYVVNLIVADMKRRGKMR